MHEQAGRSRSRTHVPDAVGKGRGRVSGKDARASIRRGDERVPRMVEARTRRASSDAQALRGGKQGSDAILQGDAARPDQARARRAVQGMAH